MELGAEDFTAYRFRLYPSKRQEAKMEAILETCRLLWNDALEQRNDRWKVERKRTTYEMQSAALTQAKEGNPELRAVYSQALQDALRRLDGGFKKFFTHEAGHPRFKKRGECGSFTYPQASNGSVKPDITGKRLHLSKIGSVRTVFHREFPSSEVKTCTVKKDSDGRWHASLVFEDAVVPLQGIAVPQSWKAPVGVDLGLKSLIATSDGQKIEPPKFYRKGEVKLIKLQRKLSRKEKGSKNRAKAKHLLASQHSRVANQRMDFNQKLSTKLVKAHDLIGFEDLRVKNMAKNHLLAKSIHDAGWSQLAKFAEYKARKRRKGKLVVKVLAQYTTQECWFCGAKNQVPLSVREFPCIKCHRWLDRDVNAGRVVLKRAIVVARDQVGQDRSGETRAGGENHPRPVPELKPVEAGRKRSRPGSAARPVKQELDAPIQALEARPFRGGRMSLMVPGKGM